MDTVTKILRKISDSMRLQLVGTAFITVLLGLFIYKTAPSLEVWWPRPAALLFSGLFALAMLLLIAEKRFDALQLLAAAACLCCAMYARVALLPYHSGDYDAYISKWADELASMSFKDALATPVGNYNLPYIYYLAVLTRFNAERLIHIKAFSCFFDVILAWAVMKLTRIGAGEDRRLTLGAFIIVLLSPTVMIDSALWSQCDSVYTAFCLIAILAAVKGRGRLCVISWSVAFCFKLQAVFILPALAAALFMGKIKPRELIWFPLVYLISILPALAAGRSFSDCVSIYVNQMGKYTGLCINAPTVWQLFGNTAITEIPNMAVYVALGFLVLFTAYCLSFAKKLDEKLLVKLFFLSAFLAPYLLPRMHERYFYMAEILALVYFMYDRRKWYVPVTITLSSLSCYMEYFILYRMSSAEEYASQTTGIKFIYLSIAFLVILAHEGRDIFKELWSATPDTLL